MNKIYWSIIGALLLISFIFTDDRLTWALEIFPVVIAGIVLYLTREKFPLTRLTYTLIFIHCLILIYGGWYTYANTPLGNVLRDMLNLERNPYDRIGHIAQGFIPAIIVRELLIRIGKFQLGTFLNISTVFICLGVSAAYELVEWGAALILGQGANEFLGMQGDQWDTQWDMFLAMTGAVLSLLLLSKFHFSQLAENNWADKEK